MAGKPDFDDKESFLSNSENEEKIDDMESVLVDICREKEIEDAQLLGSVFGLVNPLVIISPVDKNKLLDKDTIIVHGDSNKAVGKIWDIFGPLESPYYSAIVFQDVFKTISCGDRIYFKIDAEKRINLEEIKLKSTELEEFDDHLSESE